MKSNPRLFKFWYETKSSNVVMTDVMLEKDAIDWLKMNSYAIVACQINERTTAEKLLKQILGEKLQ